MEAFNLKVIEFMDIPQEYEAAFLRDIAKKLSLQPGVPQDIFEKRLSVENLDDDWSKLVELLKQKVTAKSARQHYWSREILPKLRDFGFRDEGRKLWIEARQWLAQTQFKPWLWEQLTQKAQRTQQMGVKDPRGGEKLGMLPKNNYLDKVPLNSEVIFEIQLLRSGHLTLLEREPNGNVVCLCPSPFAQKSQFMQENRVILPQANNSVKVFKPNEAGTEQLLALLTRESPGFDWLERSRQEALKLQASHLQEVFEYVTKEPLARLLYTEYEVVE